MTTMKVLKGSGLNADTIEIIVTDDSSELFRNKYYYGYDISYNPSWATKDKPYDKELVKSIASQYKISDEQIEYGEGVNIFKDSMKD